MGLCRVSKVSGFGCGIQGSGSMGVQKPGFLEILSCDGKMMQQ